MVVREFQNEPLTDFSLEPNRRRMEEALRSVASRLGQEHELIIGGERIKTQEKFYSYNPAQKNEVVGIFQLSGELEADRALDTASRAFEDWRWVPAEERASLLFRAAQRMRYYKFELAAWEVYEVGKTWVEADADVAEAIDFLEYYGREILKLSAPQPLIPYPGEADELVYIPLGVGLVIPPWNFPLAILVGTTSASFVTGNTVILKPSSDAPMIATRFVEILEEVGLPPGVVNLITGPGGEVGDYLVGHPRIRFINFTGSKEVGLRIVERAAITAPGQIWIKRVVAEMGGKDAIIIDDEADLNDALSGVIASAFGFQGQKCSACSRAIVLHPIYDRFLESLVERASRLRVDMPRNPEADLGPVINERAFRSILDYIELGRGEGRLCCGGEPVHPLQTGYFIKPTVFADVRPDARIAQEEIFGPVLVVIRAKDFDEAIEIANSTVYGLTGSVYTRNRSKILKAKQRFHVGNLYINRKCTGALVGVHPFGGFNLSGTDSKAGGPDYLLLFLQAKAIGERL